jgi:hypothetical protein
MLDRAATSELDTLVSAAFSQSGIEMPIIVSGANIDED